MRLCLGLYNRNPVSVTPLQCYHVEETVALINEAESGKLSRQLADQFNIGRMQATSIIKRKAELLLEYDRSVIYSCKCNTDFSVTYKYII